jgi:hemerythrin superfamily protein
MAATRSTARSSTSGGPKAKKSAGPAKSASPDVIAALKADHQEVEALFQRFEGLGKTAHKSREATVKTIIVALSKHAAVEEQIVYPDARRRLSSDEDLVFEALEEHHIVKWTLSELESMQSTDERYSAKVAVLTEAVRHHVKDEETELFPKLRKAATPAELREMGQAVRDAKRAAPDRPHPRSPDTPPGNVVSAVLAKPLDTAARLAEGAADKVRGLTT